MTKGKPLGFLNHKRSHEDNKALGTYDATQYSLSRAY